MTPPIPCKPFKRRPRATWRVFSTYGRTVEDHGFCHQLATALYMVRGINLSGTRAHGYAVEIDPPPGHFRQW